MSSDSFKIRSDLISVAKDILMTEYDTKKNALEQVYYHQRELNQPSTLKNKFGIEDGNPNAEVVPYPTIPSVPSAEDIVAYARKLNTFVSHP